MKPILPSAALTTAHVPSPDAPASEVIRFATSMNGYQVVGGKASDLGRYVKRFGGDAYEDLSLDDLRILLFARQRQHYHQGGGYPGEPDALVLEMRAIIVEVARRIEARGPGMGVWQGNITRLKVDAIVNAANKTLAGGGGVDGAIHRAAGPNLKEACLELPEVSPSVRCPVGEARITEGFKLPAQHVIHAVGPVWRGGDDGERGLLAAAYRNSLALAAEHKLATIAFPTISTGAFSFPAHEAARIAVETIAAFQARRAAPERMVLVAFDAKSEKAWRQALQRHARV